MFTFVFLLMHKTVQNNYNKSNYMHKTIQNNYNKPNYSLQNLVKMQKINTESKRKTVTTGGKEHTCSAETAVVVIANSYLHTARKN